MESARIHVKERLLELADEKYREFHSGLVPGEEGILGVRIPELRKAVKGFIKEEGLQYLYEMKEITPEMPEVSYEEIMVEGMMIGYGKLTLAERFFWLDIFVPKIRNWGICDCCVSTYKFMEKHPEESWKYLQKYLSSGKEYEIRFALVSILDYFIKEEYLSSIFAICNGVHHEGYYVKMAMAWLVSVCYVKFPEETECFLEDNRMDDFTQNKSIQKIRESYRVSQEAKERLKELKRAKV